MTRRPRYTLEVFILRWVPSLHVTATPVLWSEAVHAWHYAQRVAPAWNMYRVREVGG